MWSCLLEQTIFKFWHSELLIVLNVQEGKNHCLRGWCQIRFGTINVTIRFSSITCNFQSLVSCVLEKLTQVDACDFCFSARFFIYELKFRYEPQDVRRLIYKSPGDWSWSEPLESPSELTVSFTPCVTQTRSFSLISDLLQWICSDLNRCEVAEWSCCTLCEEMLDKQSSFFGSAE